jgi:hypothetical protein
MHLIGSTIPHLIPLWLAWRGGGMGVGHLPFAGGAGDQPAVLMDAFSIMEDAFAKLKPKRPEGGGDGS